RRFVCVLRLSSREVIRIDLMWNSTTVPRQIQYVSINRQLRKWFVCGYVVSPAASVVCFALLFIWCIVFGFNWRLVVLLVSMSLVSTACSVSCTRRVYEHGVRQNMLNEIFRGRPS